MDKDVDDLHVKLSDDIDLSKWRQMNRVYWSDRSSDSDTES